MAAPSYVTPAIRHLGKPLNIANNALIELVLRRASEIGPLKRPLQLRSLPEILFNSAAMVTAKICAIRRNACESLTTSCVPQKRAQPIPRTQLILLRCLVSSHQIHEHLGSGGRHPYRCQISGSMTARQIQGIPPISLGPVASLDRSRRRHNNLNDHCRLQRR